jgi:hypothetical protein
MAIPKSNLAYEKYWLRKQALASTPPHFPLKRWWRTDGLSEIEACYLEAIRDRESILDVGAGDLRVKEKMIRAGYGGVYHTMDIASEYHHTYNSLDQVDRKYAAIICLDVIEHMTLADGMQMLARFMELLDDDGVVVLQTPNAKCIRNPMAWDMTHLHVYNLPDLWAHFKSFGFEAIGYRVWFVKERPSVIDRFRMLLTRVAVARIIGADYADNISIIARFRRGI